MRGNSGFVNGSLAEKAIYEEQPYYGDMRDAYYMEREYKRKEAKRTELNATIAANREILKKEVNMRKERRLVRVKYIAMISALFVLFVAMIYRFSMVIEINSEITKYNADLSRVRNNADVLKKDISRETDLERVRVLAESRLNMQKPDAHQYIYIKVPRNDHALLRAENA